MSFQKSCQLIINKINENGEKIPENLSKIVAGSEQDLQLFDKEVEHLNVIDVYKIAASIGKEFEKLTDAFGGVVFSAVMPKLIRILEMFELLVKNREINETKIATLTQEVEDFDKSLKMKNVSEAKEMTKLQLAWEDRMKDLKSRNEQLEADNRKLLSIASEQTDNIQNENEVVEEIHKMNKLQEELEELRKDQRHKNRMIEEHTADCAALQSQIDKMAKLNSTLRYKVTILQQQATTLINEKSTLQSQLNSKTPIGLKSVIKEEFIPKVEIIQQNTEQEKDLQDCSIIKAESINDPLLANKLIIDLNDPNRPRYTLQELLEVLNDRNQLKARCFRLEEELIFYKDVSRKLGYCDEAWEEISAREVRQLSKPYMQSEVTADVSGIRRFFSYLATDLWGKKEVPSPQPIRRTKPSTYHEAKETLVSDVEVRDLAPRLLLDDCSSGDSIRIVRSNEMKPLNRLATDIDGDSLSDVDLVSNDTSIEDKDNKEEI